MIQRSEYVKKGLYYIGDKQATIANNIIIGDEKLIGTPGLWELIMSKEPIGFNNEDYENYAKLMVKTNALHYGYDPDNPHPRSSGGYKWKILKYIWGNREKYEGKELLLFRAILTRC